MPDLSPTETINLQNLIASLCPNLSLALAEQINRDLSLDVMEIEAVPIQDMLISIDNVVQTIFALNQPSTAESVIMYSEDIGCLFADLIAGNDGSAPPALLTEKLGEALSGAMNGLARGIATALTNLTGDTIDLESSVTTAGSIALPPVFALDGNAVRVKLALSIPELIESEIAFLFTPEFARALAPGDAEDADEDSSLIGEDDLAAMLSGLSGIGGNDADISAPTQGGGGFGGPAAAPANTPFNNFQSAPADFMPRGLEMILDIPLDVTVELGRVKMLIKDVLELASGSIIELDRVAGEPVDLLVNGRLVAKGEVVVIEDNFGIRITEIVSPADRVAGLGKV